MNFSRCFLAAIWVTTAWAAPLDKADIAARRAELERREAALRDPAEPGTKEYLSREYVSLAAILRFRLRQSDDALSALQASRRLRPAQGFDLAAANIADLYRFDKRDPRRALEHYRLALASLDSAGQPGSSEALVAKGLQRWLRSEIDYLERGKRFSGAIGRDDMGVAQLWLMFAFPGESPDPAIGPRELDALPASQFQLARTFPIAQRLLPPREMLAFYARHDPAGYLTGAMLALGARMEPAPYVNTAAATFFAERGIKGSAAPDPRYSSPEKTWALFLAGAKGGNADAMLACFTPDMGAKLRELFKRMSRDELRKMGESFVSFAMQAGSGEFRDAVVIRQSGEAKKAGFIQFLNDGGEWKIESM